jgi:hypothetical protein
MRTSSRFEIGIDVIYWKLVRHIWFTCKGISQTIIASDEEMNIYTNGEKAAKLDK